MLRRRVWAKLEDWRQSRHRKALLLTGARQVGKTFIVREFARQRYQSYVEINLLENTEARSAFASASNLQDFITRITLFSSNELVRGNSLVMFDEIQELPDITTMAKFLVDDGRFDYVFTGSMLGTELKRIRSFPVGYATELKMYPLDFEEFCWSIGISQEALRSIWRGYESGVPIDQYIHESMLRNFRSYIVVGGMPEVVQRFVDNGGDLMDIRSLQSDLITQYRYDITKYAPRRALQIGHIFDQVPQQIDDQTRRFIVNSVDPGARYDRYQQDFLWLVDAGVALKCDSVHEPRSPLKRTREASKFKFFQSDVGLLMSCYPQSTSRAVYLDDRTANLGGIYENAIAQQLTAKGYDLFYYEKGARAEVDFIVDGAEGSLPIEVKSGRNYTSHAALDSVLSTPDFHCQNGIVFCRSNVSIKDRVIYLPFYMTMCLPEGNAAGEEGFALETVVV